MSEDAEMWAKVKEERQAKKLDNAKKSLAILKEKGVAFTCLSESAAHYRIGEYDIWLTTGKWIHRATREYGRGIFNLLRRIV